MELGDRREWLHRCWVDLSTSPRSCSLEKELSHACKVSLAGKQVILRQPWKQTHSLDRSVMEVQTTMCHKNYRQLLIMHWGLPELCLSEGLMNLSLGRYVLAVNESKDAPITVSSVQGLTWLFYIQLETQFLEKNKGCLDGRQHCFVGTTFE